MMNQEDIFKKIGQILMELNEQYQYLAQNPRELNELELELFLANSKFLSDHVQIIKKINGSTGQKALAEQTEIDEAIAAAPAVSNTVVIEPVVVEPVIHHMEDDIFKLDNEPASFEFILSDKPSSDRFDFEERSVDEIFDRPLSKEEEQIIAQKQKLREMDSLGVQPSEEDEIGPEPFLVSGSAHAEPAEPELQLTTPVAAGYTGKDVEEQEPTEARSADPEPIHDPAIEEEPVKEDSPEPAPVEADPIIEEPFKEEPVQVVSTPAVEVHEPVKSQLQEELFTPIRSEVLPRPTLNDILSGNSTLKNVHAQNNRTPITDLKQAINLNDKMRYIKDLFNGYSLAYAEAIDLLNKMPDFKSADSFLQHNYAVKNNWAARQDTADQFYELLNQRFPAVK